MRVDETPSRVAVRGGSETTNPATLDGILNLNLVEISGRTSNCNASVQRDEPLHVYTSAYCWQALSAISIAWSRVSARPSAQAASNATSSFRAVRASARCST